MKKATIFAVLAVLFAVAPIMQAQDTPSNQAAPKKEAPKKTAYRVDFKLYEIEDGKRINQREYSLIASAVGHRSGGSSLRIGTRVPVSVKEKEETYLDVGLGLQCDLWQEDDKLWGAFDVEISNFALPEQNADPRVGGKPPVLRTARQRMETSLTVGKSQILTSLDDVNSKKRTLVEVVATRID